MFCVHPTSNEALKGSRFFDSPNRHAVIAAGGVEERPGDTAALLGPIDLVLAAGGGYRLLQKLDLACDYLVGDFDTLSREEVESARQTGCVVRQFPADKAKSDLELAIEQAYQSGATQITFVGALGGEWDHCVANLLAPLSLCAEYGMWGRLLTSQAQIYLTQGPVRLEAIGRRVSLAALSESVEGLTLRGLEYALDEARLRRVQTLGLANRVVESVATIEFRQGELLVTVLH